MARAYRRKRAKGGKVKAYKGDFVSPKVSFYVNLAYKALRPLIPFNLSADFIFICSTGVKNGQ
jgi:hypothetical protein